MSSRKFEDLIKRKKDILEKVRKEREQLQIDKKARAEEKINKAVKPSNTFEEINKVCMSFGIPPVAAEVNILKSEKSKKELGLNSQQLATDSYKAEESKTLNKLQKLSVSTTNITDIQPARILTYTKSTQTNISRVPLKLVIPKYDENEDLYSPEGGYGSRLPPGCMSPGLPKLHFIEPAVTILENIQEENTKVKELTEEEKQAIITSKNFQRSLKRLGCVMENVVAKNINITKDYIKGSDFEDEDDIKTRGRVSLSHTMYDKRWSKQRCVTSMDWSNYYPEMMVAAYHSNESAPLEPEGIVIVWNTKSKTHIPEYVFHSHSAVISTCFAKYNPNVVVGGTYSGQIVVWDNRSATPIPVQSTKLNGGAHMQPIHSMKWIGPESSHNLVTISSDGKLCSWSLDMLSAPVESLILEKAEKRPVASTCMTFLGKESSEIIVGSEDGYIYSASRFGMNAGINGKFGLHEGPITSISMHNIDSTLAFQNLFLTSSMDSTIKMWSRDNLEPIHTFVENCDYVMDVAWSPLHPSLFAAIDASGRLDLWNLNIDIETPIVPVVVRNQPALNRLTWSPNGLNIVVGDVDGNIFLYNIVDRLALPLPGERSVFDNTVKSFM